MHNFLSVNYFRTQKKTVLRFLLKEKTFEKFSQLNIYFIKFYIESVILYKYVCEIHQKKDFLLLSLKSKTNLKNSH